MGGCPKKPVTAREYWTSSVLFTSCQNLYGLRFATTTANWFSSSFDMPELDEGVKAKAIYVIVLNGFTPSRRLVLNSFLMVDVT